MKLFQFAGPGLIRLHDRSTGLTPVDRFYVCGSSRRDCWERARAILGNWSPALEDFTSAAKGWDYFMKGIAPAPGVWIKSGIRVRDQPKKVA